MKQKLCLLAAVFLLLMGVGSGLEVGHWHLNETSTNDWVRDFSGFDNNGTIFGDPTQQADGVTNSSGEWDTGNAYRFDGTDDYVNVSSSTGLEVTGNITVSGWVKPDTAHNGIIVGKGESGGSENYVFQTQSGGTLRFFFRDTGGSAHVVQSDGDYPVGQLFHVVGVYDKAAGEQRLYVNGTLNNTNNVGDVTLQTGTGWMGIGARCEQSSNGGCSSAQSFFDGMIDEPHVYNQSVNETGPNSARNLMHFNQLTEANAAPTFHSNTTEPPRLKYNDVVNVTATVNDTDADRENGAVSSGAEWDTDGKYGSALDFNTSDEHVAVTDTTNMDDLGNYSVSYWVNPRKKQESGGGEHFLNKGTPWNTGGFSFKFKSNNGPSHTIVVQVGNSTGDNAILGTNSGKVKADQWQHITLTVRDNGIIRLYYNGTQVDSTTQENPTSSAKNFCIGSFKCSGGDNTLNGSIDEVQFYSSVLSSQSIKAIYENQTRGTGLEGDWRFDEGSGDTAWDTGNLFDNVSASTTEAGTTLYDQPLPYITTNTDGTLDYRLTDIFTADQKNTWYNTTYTATDRDGTTTTAENLQYIDDNPPNVTVFQPENVTEYDYDQDYRFHANDSDDVTGETFNCDVINDSATFNTHSGTENLMGSGSFRAGFGQHNFTVSCNDDAGNNGRDTVFFTVDDYKIFPPNGPTQTYETVNESYNVTVHLGDMVNTVAANFLWNTTTDGRTFIENSRERNVTINESFESELVDVNNTDVKFRFNFTFNRTERDGSFTPDVNDRTANTTQSVFHGVWLQSAQVDPTSYVEDEDYNFFMNFTVQNYKPGFTPNNTYHRTGDTVDASIDSNASTYIRYTASQNVGNVSTSNNESYNTSGRLGIMFNGDSRTIDTANQTLYVNQILLTSCGSGTASQTVALNFTTADENERDTLVSSDLGMSVEVWKQGNPGFTRSYNFSSTDSTFHEFCLYPADRTYVVDNTEDKLIQYEATDYSQRSYFLINESISSTVTTVPLYLLNTSASTEVEYVVKDEDNQDADGVVIKIERYFETLDKHIVVAMVRTGSEGTSRTFLEKNEIYYQHKFYVSKELVDEKGNQLIPKDDEFNFQIGADALISYYELKNDVSFNCVTATTFVNCSYSTSNEKMDEIILDVDAVQKIGFRDVCTNTGTTSSGELACTGLNSTNTTYKYTLRAIFNDGSVVVLESDMFGGAANILEDMGLLIGFALFITMGFAGLFLPEAVIILGTLALVVNFSTPLVALPPGAIMSIVLVAGILLWRMT